MIQNGIHIFLGVDCLFERIGEGYAGSQSITKDGVNCHTWTEVARSTPINAFLFPDIIRFLFLLYPSIREC